MARIDSAGTEPALLQAHCKGRRRRRQDGVNGRLDVWMQCSRCHCAAKQVETTRAAAMRLRPTCMAPTHWWRLLPGRGGLPRAFELPVFLRRRPDPRQVSSAAPVLLRALAIYLGWADGELTRKRASTAHAWHSSMSAAAAAAAITARCLPAAACRASEALQCTRSSQSATGRGGCNEMLSSSCSQHTSPPEAAAAREARPCSAAHHASRQAVHSGDSSSAGTENPSSG